MCGAPGQDRGSHPQEGPQGQEAESQGQGLTVTRRIVRIRNGQTTHAGDTIAIERTISLFLGQRRLLRLQCLPEKLEDLALGLLVSSGLLPLGSPPPPVACDLEAGVVRVEYSPDEEALATLLDEMTLGSGCGAALTPDGRFDPLSCERRIDAGFSIEAATLSAATTAFVRRSRLFKTTGGVHAAAIASGNQIIAFAEDVGRHNAFDKVVGACYRQGIDLVDKIALATGRLSRELVAKAIPVSLPLVASRSAPTSAAAELADEANLTLVGFVRAGRMNIYTHPWRVRS